MLRPEGLEALAQQPGREPSCPLVEIADDQPRVGQFLLAKHLRTEETRPLRAPLHVPRSEVHVEDVNGVAAPYVDVRLQHSACFPLAVRKVIVAPLQQWETRQGHVSIAAAVE